ncbi:glycoside hydrolase family 13 protein [Tenacibaculum sp. TC6]|uniref:glycoside hydrolase family 13 protein n=1 Tax=Tenacibaculum sp. TC6 TaxID=3423223 RepID=UPI003D36E24E
MTDTSFAEIERVEPPNWWIGFKNTGLQLLVKEDRIANYEVTINYEGVKVTSVTKGDSENYVFIDLSIHKNTKPGTFTITFKDKEGKEKKHNYELKKRIQPANDYKGFDSTDAIYLITPDRFSNGNIANDKIAGLKEQKVDRTHDYMRHGGDIEGIINHIEYIKDLGFTTVWPTPLLLNDMKESSYHGYAITDYYKVDPRFGTLKDYKKLAQELAKRDMKLIMDQVANHCGLYHWWMNDLPFKDWLNYQKQYEEYKDTWSWKNVIVSNHRRTTNQDIYASTFDKNRNTKGWFVAEMPDLNQRNPFMANYIIQNSIWWIETLQLGGIRQDTYPYPDKEFMAKWSQSIMNEYPNFTIVGEEWSYNPLLIGYWQKGAINKDGYVSDLKSTMDFAMQKNSVEALNEEEGWNKGLIKMYEGLANDFHYASPENIMIFPDNHDMSRIFTQLKGNFTNTKAALSYLLVLPRIPQLYYGTEILMNDFEKPGDHGLVRSDFPGGWNNDTVNAFTGKGLSEQQKEMQEYVKKLLNYRKKSKAIHKGTTIHFAPEEGVYVLFRKFEKETVIHIINKNDKNYRLNLARFHEIGLSGKSLRNIITNESVVWNEFLELSQNGSIILTTDLEN